MKGPRRYPAARCRARGVLARWRLSSNSGARRARSGVSCWRMGRKRSSFRGDDSGRTPLIRHPPHPALSRRGRGFYCAAREKKPSPARAACAARTRPAAPTCSAHAGEGWVRGKDKKTRRRQPAPVIAQRSGSGMRCCVIPLAGVMDSECPASLCPAVCILRCRAAIEAPATQPEQPINACLAAIHRWARSGNLLRPPPISAIRTNLPSLPFSRMTAFQRLAVTYSSKRPVASRSRSYRLVSGNGGNQDSRRWIQLS